MKTTYFLLGATIACLVHARPAAPVSGLETTSFQGDTFAGAQAGPAVEQAPPASSSLSPSPSTSATGSGSNGGEVVVEYFDVAGPPDHFPYGTCISFRKPGHMIKSFQVTTLAACYTYLDQGCKISQQPLLIPDTPFIKVPNAANLGAALLEAFLCLEFSQSPTGQHVTDPSMFGPLQHIGMGLTPPKAGSNTHH